MNGLSCLFGIVSIISTALSSQDLDRLDELRKLVPASAPFNAWIERSEEAPPDFSAMPSYAPLPPPLSPVAEGATMPVIDIPAWQQERKRLLGELHHWILGTIPESPTNLLANTLSDQSVPGGRIREVELRFGPDHKAHLWVNLYIPEGDGPFPVFMTQDNHRGWAQIALRRGYIGCVYAGADDRDDTDSFVEAWPGYDWSRLMRRGWAAGRCLDYLATLPEADTTKCALAGHSRNGKTSLMGAAVDERIALVISSSSGVGGCIPSRYCGESTFGEGIEHITRTFPEWFHPRWRFFCGREHKIPVDLHHLVSMAAPRPCLLSIALNDTVEHTWAMQKTYLSVKPVYELYGEEDNFRILWRPGGHETWTEVIERYLDWCDVHFGRGDFSFEETYVYPWDWQGWHERATQPFSLAEQPERPWGSSTSADIDGIVRRFLGKMPPRGAVANMSYGKMTDAVLARYGREDAGTGLERDQLVFGEYISAEVYLPEGTMSSDRKLPGILYLPPFCAPTGYHAAYKRGEQAYRNLARAGYAVFCFDPIGTGRRVDEARHFYERHPDWSLLGKMTRDAQAALDAIERLDYIDNRCLWVAGYESGALTAIHLAALDKRPTGLALVCPPLPYRLDTNIPETGGINRWAQERMLLPQLGEYSGKETRMPYDIDDILAARAPSPLVLITPLFDRFAPKEKADLAFDRLERVYSDLNAKNQVVRVRPETYNHFDDTMQRLLIEALKPFTRN